MVVRCCGCGCGCCEWFRLSRGFVCVYIANVAVVIVCGVGGGWAGWGRVDVCVVGLWLLLLLGGGGVCRGRPVGSVGAAGGIVVAAEC